MTLIRFRYITTDRDRHGNLRYYFRRPGKSKIRLRGLPGLEEFMTAYKTALSGNAEAKSEKLRVALPAVLQVGVFSAVGEVHAAPEADYAGRDLQYGRRERPTIGCGALR